MSILDFLKQSIKSYNSQGYDERGYDRQGYDRQGLSKDGFDRFGCFCSKIGFNHKNS